MEPGHCETAFMGQERHRIRYFRASYGFIRAKRHAEAGREVGCSQGCFMRSHSDQGLSQEGS